LALLHLAEETARRVTFAAMAGAFDEIAAAVPLLALLWVGRKAGVGKKKELPTAHRATDGERKGERVLRRLPLDRRQRSEERGEIGDILRRHPLIGRVRESGVQMAPVPRDAREKRIGDVDRPPGADSVGRVARYVRRVERPERRLEFEPAAELERVVLAWRLVAGLAAAGEKDQPPGGGVASKAKRLPLR